MALIDAVEIPSLELKAVDPTTLVNPPVGDRRLAVNLSFVLGMLDDLGTFTPITSPISGATPADTAAAAVVGVATAPPHADHAHRLGAHDHAATAGHGGIVPSTSISGLAAVATSGAYADLSGSPDPVLKSLFTTKGDLVVATSSGVVVRQAVGTNGQVLTADSAQASGIKWAAGGGGGASPLTTKGDLWGFDTADARVPVGSNGQVLTADSGDAQGVSWQTPTGGGGGSSNSSVAPPALVLLEQHTASSSAQLDFTTFISSLYDDYMIELVSIVPATDGANLQVRVGTGAGPTYDTGGNYDWQYTRVNSGGGGFSAGHAGSTSMAFFEAIKSADSGCGTYRAYDLASTTVKKRFIGDVALIQNDNTFYRAMFGCQWTTAGTAATALRFFMSSGNIASGTIRIYGITKDVAGVIGAGVTDYIQMREEQASGTSGGTFTSGAWQTRVLNTKVNDTGGIATLASNQFTLPAGTYRILATAPAHNVQLNKLRLQNITDASTLLLGTSLYSASGGADDQILAELQGEFTLTATKTLELQHRCSSTKTSDGFGTGDSFGVTEVFATVELWRGAAVTGGTFGVAALIAHQYLGTNNIGSSNESMTLHRDIAKKVTPAADGQILGVEAYISPSGNGLHTFMAAVWTDNAGEIGDLIALGPATGAILRSGHADWVSTPVSFKLTAGVSYWIGVIWASEGSGQTISIYYNTGGSDRAIADSVDNYVRSGAAGLSPSDTTKNYSIRAGFLPTVPATTPSVVSNAVAVIQDQKAQNTAGGTFTSGAWRTRDLNTIVTDSMSIVTALSSNQFTLQAGSYRVRASAPAFYVGSHQIRLQNITDAITQIIGQNAYNEQGLAQGVVTNAELDGRFTISAAKVFEIQHQCTTTRTTDGFGVLANFGTEVYATVEIEREGFSGSGDPMDAVSDFGTLSESTSSLTYVDLATVGPSVSLQTGAEVLVVFSSVLNNSVASGHTGFVSVEVSGATTIAASDAHSFYAASPGAGFGLPGSRVVHLTGLTPGLNTFTLKYKCDGNTWAFDRRAIAVILIPSNSPSTGGMVLLEQHAASASATLDFTSAISSLYDEYVIELINVVPATNSVYLYLRCSTDGGATYDAGASAYGFEAFRWIASATAVDGSNDSADHFGIDGGVGEISNTASRGGVCGSFRLYNPGSTSVIKRVTGQVTWPNSSGANDGASIAGFYNSTTAVNALRFLFSSGNITSGTVRVYGIAK